MGALLYVLLVLILVVVPAVGLYLSTVPLRLNDVRFRDTDVAHAWYLIAHYASGTFEQRFGYPTGYFYVDDKRSQQPSRILMREAQPAGAVTDGCSAQLGSLGLSGFGEGCAAGCMTFFVVAFIGAPFFLVSFGDRFFRLLLRSRVDVRVSASGPDAVATFAFYGPGGYSLRRRYAQVFEKPVLPAALTTPESGAQEQAAPAAPAAPGRHR